VRKFKAYRSDRRLPEHLIPVLDLGTKTVLPKTLQP
jgi:hypothetical protein